MNDRLIVMCLVAAVAGGCATSPRDEPTTADARPAASSRQDVAAADASFGVASDAGADRSADATRERETAGVGVQDAGGARSAAGVWADPMFERRLVESYAAETEIEPQVTLDEREVMLEILELISAQDLEGAAAKLDKERGPTSSAVFDFTLGNVRFQQERLADAAAAYADAIEKFPKFRRAHGNLAQIRFRDADYAGAVRGFSRVIELGGVDTATFGMLGIAQSKRGQDTAAESAFRMAMMFGPDTQDWKLGLAESLFKQARYADAAALFEGMLADQPDRVDLWLAQGEAYARMGSTMDAAHDFEVVDRLGGSTAESLNNLGDIYAREELFDLAVDAYVRAMAKAPDDPIDRVLRAARYISANGALAETKQLVTAIESARGDRLGTDERKGLLGLRARIAVAEGAGDEEAKVLQQIVEIDPLDGEALILLGQHSARADDAEQAIFYFERAASIEAFEADAKVRHAQLLVSKQKYAEALPLLRRAQTLKPRDNIQDYLEQVERIAQSR